METNLDKEEDDWEKSVSHIAFRGLSVREGIYSFKKFILPNSGSEMGESPNLSPNGSVNLMTLFNLPTVFG